MVSNSPASRSIGRARLACALAGLGALALATIAPLQAQQSPTPENLDQGFYQSYLFGAPADPSEEWVLAYGGRLYDLWWIVLLSEPPERKHPAYPESGTAQGADTWRCVACHGWDYRGAAGAFGAGPHYTGIKGIEAMAGADPASIAALLRKPPHGFDAAMIPDEALHALALFVSRGQGKPGQQIDAGTGRFQGNPAKGKPVFQNICAICHDFDGRAWITGEDDGLNNLGAIATADPWRALHKVLNGQTYADMPALRALHRQTVLDVLSYLQTLPSEAVAP